MDTTICKSNCLLCCTSGFNFINYVVHRVPILLPVSKIMCTIPTLRWRWINLGMFVLGNYKNHYNIWYRISNFQHWDGLIWECLFSGLTKITAPRLLHHALPPFYKCWKLKLKRRERMKRLKTLELKKLVASIKGEVLWLFQGAMQHQYVPLLNMELVAHCHLKG